MNAIIVDTSIWIDAFRGEGIAPLEDALKQGRVLLPPLVLSEVLSGSKSKAEQKRLEDFFEFIPLCPSDRQHWADVGLLRAHLIKEGFLVSVPDCHIAQCALEVKGVLLSRDKIFQKIAPILYLKVDGCS